MVAYLDRTYVVSVAQWLACWAHNENVVGSSHGLSTCDCRENNLGLVVKTNVPLSTQVYKWVGSVKSTE